MAGGGMSYASQHHELLCNQDKGKLLPGGLPSPPLFSAYDFMTVHPKLSSSAPFCICDQEQ
jgi:hypothetical protein